MVRGNQNTYTVKLGYEILLADPTSFNPEWCTELWSLKVFGAAKVMVVTLSAKEGRQLTNRPLVLKGMSRE